MAENRCSMCGKPNAADESVCEHCGARLTPMKPSNAGKFTGGLSWLDAFREETGGPDEGETSVEQEASAEPAATEEDDESPEWLQNIHQRTDSDGAEEDEIEENDEIQLEDQSFVDTQAEGDVPDWLRNLKGDDEQPAVEEEKSEAVDEDIPHWADALRTWDAEETADDDFSVDEESDDGLLESKPRVTEWFNRILPGNEQESHEETEEQVPAAQVPQQSQQPSNFIDDSASSASMDEVEIENWQERSAKLTSVTESSSDEEEVPSWLQGDEETAAEDSSQSVLNWLQKLDEEEGGRQKARYWMGEVDTGDLPAERTLDPRFAEPEEKTESVYDPFSEGDADSAGATQFFSESELAADDMDEESQEPGHTMIFEQPDDDEAIPDWMADQPGGPATLKSGRSAHTVGLSGLDDADLGMDLPEEEQSPWEKAAKEGDVPATSEKPASPKMTAALTGLDEEESGDQEEIPPWLQDVETPTTPVRKETPIMTAELGDFDDEDLGDDTTDAETPPWVQQTPSDREETKPRMPIMTAELSGLDDEDLGMDLPEDEIPPWLKEVEQREEDEKPGTPIMTAVLDDLDEDDEDEETPPWILDTEIPADEKKQSLMTAAKSDLGETSFETEEVSPWMQNIDESTSEAKPAPMMTAELSDLDEGNDGDDEEIPPWMQDVEEVAVPKKGTTMMTAALTGLDDEELDSVDDAALPWMQEIEEVVPPAKSTPLMTAALTGLDDEDLGTDEEPAWMKDIEEVTRPSIETPLMTAALTDLDEEFGDAVADDIPDWMKNIEETQQPPETTQLEHAEAVVKDVKTSPSPKPTFMDDLQEKKEKSPGEPTIDEMYSDQLLTTGKLNEMVGKPGAAGAVEPEEQSIDEMFSDQLLTTGKLNEMVGQPPTVDDSADDEKSVDEMYSDQLLTTGILNEMVGQPPTVDDSADDEKSVDEMYSDQLLTTGILNEMVGQPPTVDDSADDEKSVDEMYSDQLLTTGILNEMVGQPPTVDDSADDEKSVDEMYSDQLLTTGILNEMVGQPPTTEDQSVDEAFSEDLLNTGRLRQLSGDSESADDMTVDEEFSSELLTTGRLRDLSEEDAAATNVSDEEDWLASFAEEDSKALTAGDDMLVGASVADEDEVQDEIAPTSDMPVWLTELEPEAVETEPSVKPAFTFDEEPDMTAKVEESHPFAGDDLPNWLSPDVWQANGQKDETAPAKPQAGGVQNIQWELEGLEKGELPSWLQQVKPDQLVTQKRLTTATADGETQSEKVGPLAGLRGVLPARDMLTKHRKPPVYSDQINLSERQSNRMQVLSRMIESEAKNRMLKVGEEKIPFNMMRIIFALILVIVMIFPLSGLLPITGSLPFAASDPVIAFYNEVEQFPADSSVLLVMDFESGYTAEMRSSMDGLLLRLYEKNIDVAMISTLPTGPVIGEEIAQDMWLQYFNVHPEINVGDYETRVLNMGYLPGGSAAMLQFVRYPQQSVKYGFRYEKEPTSVWQSQVLSDIQSTNDFAGVVVITDSANVSRNWIEQSTLYSLDNILFITSAQTYPLILPYWQSGQVKGLIAGIYQGYTYRTLLNQSTGLAAQWYSYQFGMNLVTIVVILLTVVFIIRNAIPRRNTSR
ncbi:MAG: zinc ribbon domain-containing protein [Anaerolineaceae bacterium]|nr:zinc ribbon domain-containing protein [Anaerolineaceae bacterium]